MLKLLRRMPTSASPPVPCKNRLPVTGSVCICKGFRSGRDTSYGHRTSLGSRDSAPPNGGVTPDDHLAFSPRESAVAVPRTRMLLAQTRHRQLVVSDARDANGCRGAVIKVLPKLELHTYLAQVFRRALPI